MKKILKTITISRLVLDNIKNIKAYWATMTLNLAMVAQEFGANDLDGTIEKKVYKVQVVQSPPKAQV